MRDLPEARPSLVRLFGEYPTDKDTDHSYGEVYDRLLAPLRDAAHRVLELGVDRGGSLRAWRDYFSTAFIYGVDLDDKKHLDDNRVTTIKADLRSHPSVTIALDGVFNVRGELFDLIIDDGPHDLVQQFGCLVVLWPYLKPGGLYVVEDAIQMWEYSKVLNGLPLGVFTPDVEIIDLREAKGRTDDILIVFRKGEG